MKNLQLNYPAVFSLLALAIFAAPAKGAYTVTNGSFESWNPATGGNTPIDFPYPEVSNWTYGGTASTNGLLGAVDEAATNITDTPFGNNWLLVDTRSTGKHIYQNVGTIVLGDVLSLSALFGRQASLTTLNSNFELALYRSNGGGSVPATLLTSITKTHTSLASLAAGSTVTASSTTYTATAADAGQSLFVRIGLLTPGTIDSPVTQTFIDNITVIPEPSSSFLLLGAAGLLAVRRRR
jgi:hypothetical protein